jgi:glycerophosphoryl diester phosphodiesterase
MKIIAHRGLSQKYKENTLESLNGAIKNNIFDIEIDLMITKDYKVILQHNIIKEDSEYLTINRNYNNSDLLLETVFEKLPNNINWVLDLKDPRPSSYLVEEVLKICEKYDCINRCIFASFNLFHLLDLNIYESKTGKILKKAYSTSNLDIDFFKSKIIQYNLTHLIFDKNQISYDVIQHIKKKSQIHIYVYTINTINWYNLCLRCGIDGIFSDKCIF